MGGVQQKWEEDEARGYSDPPENLTCHTHFNDENLVRFIKSNAINEQCDYCGEDGEVIDLATLLDFINSKIKKYYGDINDQSLYLASSFDLDEDDTCGFHNAFGYAFPSYRATFESIEDLFDEIGFEVEDNDLFNDIANCFDPMKVYCLNDPVVETEEEDLSDEWDRFAKIVKHSRRYSFFEISDFLPKLGKTVLETQLIKTIKVGEKIYRSRVHDKFEIVDCFSELASPPNREAKQNRMSPAGISMFYGALDEDTAIKEVISGIDNISSKVVSTGLFSVIKELEVIDFTELPSNISIFGDYHFHMMIFLKTFVKEITQPYERDDKIHIEYIPTQIITEYFRHIFRTEEQKSVKGLIYNSAASKDGKCYVLFLDSELCQKYLHFDSVQRKELVISAIE